MFRFVVLPCHVTAQINPLTVMCVQVGHVTGMCACIVRSCDLACVYV